MNRKIANMPPFSKLASIIISSKKPDILNSFCYKLSKCAPYNIEGVSVFGPIDAPLSKIKNSYRKRFLIIVDKNKKVQNIITKWLGFVNAPSSLKIKVDIDPYNFM
jgi:primosomal protein N' (replication factor Y)